MEAIVRRLQQAAPEDDAVWYDMLQQIRLCHVNELSWNDPLTGMTTLHWALIRMMERPMEDPKWASPEKAVSTTAAVPVVASARETTCAERDNIIYTTHTATTISTKTKECWDDEDGTSFAAAATTTTTTTRRATNKAAVASSGQSSSSNSSSSSQLVMIQTLLDRYPEATLVQCRLNRWTPLATALVAIGTNPPKATAPTMTRVMQALLDTNPATLLLTDQRARSPLCLFIETVSLHRNNNNNNNASLVVPVVESTTTALSSSNQSHEIDHNNHYHHSNDECLAVCQTLVTHATTTAHMSQLCTALETLYRCNTSSIMSLTTLLFELHPQQQQQQQTIGDGDGGTTPHRRVHQLLDECWIWHWVVCLLEGIHLCQQRQQQPEQLTRGDGEEKANQARNDDLDSIGFLHLASRIVDCPTPFCLWALMRDPWQVRATATKTTVAAAPNDDDGNLPLHSVASWRYDTTTTTNTTRTDIDDSPTPTTNNPNLTSSSHNKCRKSMLLTSLVAAYPTAVKIKNRQGFNPIELEAASGAVIS